MSIRKIASYVFKRKNHAFVTNAIKYYRSLNTDIKIDKEFSIKYEKIKKQINK